MGHESDNFGVQVIEASFEAWSSFSKESLQNKLAENVIVEGIGKIRALDEEKGLITSEFIYCLMNINEEISIGMDHRAIAKKIDRLARFGKEDESNYDEVDGIQDNLRRAGNCLVAFVKKAAGSELCRKVVKSLFKIITEAISQSLDGDVDMKEVIIRLIDNFFFFNSISYRKKHH